MVVGKIWIQVKKKLEETTPPRKTFSMIQSGWPSLRTVPSLGFSAVALPPLRPSKRCWALLLLASVALRYLL
jgi:hypothetical protein